MTPYQIVEALAQHDTQIGLDEGCFCLICTSGRRPPDELIEAAREAEDALRAIAEAKFGAMVTTPKAVLRVITAAPTGALPAVAEKAPELLLEAWGAGPEHARELVRRLHAQRVDVARIITDFANASYPKRSKLERLKSKLLRIEHERARRDAIHAKLADGPKTQLQLAEITGMTVDVLSKLLARMLREGEITKTAFGTYAQSSEAAAAYEPTDEGIVRALLTLPGHRGNVAELMAITRRDRIPIYDNAKRMVTKGLLVRLSAGHGIVAVFELAPAVLHQIERGEPLQLGHKLIVFPLPTAVSAPDVVSDLRSIRSVTSL